MRTHSLKGAELLTRYSDFARGTKIILHHHEFWNGQGYPLGLKGYEIPFGSRVIAVVDAYDAMTTNRPYRTAMSADQAVQILWNGRGQQWDEIIVEAFVQTIAGEIKNPQPYLNPNASPEPQLSQCAL
jgi:HD-GYP domain-containing protein (c-di-GMP phosphodiesterase class II)